MPWAWKRALLVGGRASSIWTTTVIPTCFWSQAACIRNWRRSCRRFRPRRRASCFANLGNGRFEELIEEAGPGVAEPHMSRGCAFGDFDNDGDIHVLIVNMNEPPSLLRNDTRAGNHWLQLKLVGTKSELCAIRARVLCRYGG